MVSLFWLLCLWSFEDLPLKDEVGRRQFEIRAAHYPLEVGLSLKDSQILTRLERLGYQRRSGLPKNPGGYFWGNKHLTFYQLEHTVGNKTFPARLIRIELESGDRISAVLNDGKPITAHLEGEPLFESLREARAVRIDFDFADLPEHVWKPLLAAEDARFFDHLGLDGRALARSALANFKAGKVKQGGSTITQQLIKNRDLTPKRTFGRKASEAVRALWLESQYSKEAILEAYLNHVYLGHSDGLAIYGYATAARAIFNKAVNGLDLAEAATLAAMVQGPNRYNPLQKGDRVKDRRDWVLSRMAELGWASQADVADAKAQLVQSRKGRLEAPKASHFREWLKDVYRQNNPKRFKAGKGVVMDTTLDPLLQENAEIAVSRSLDGFRDKPAVALIAMDLRDGAVLAYVGGHGSDFDSARNALRQPGSTVKPFIALEAFSRGGGHPILHTNSLIEDKALRLDLPSGPWEPRNNDRRFHGVVSLRQALIQSYNVPFVRLGLYLGSENVAKRLRRAGLRAARSGEPAFLLGSNEVTPLDLVQAYSVFANYGRLQEARPLYRMMRPSGRTLLNTDDKGRRIASAGAAYMVHQMLEDVIVFGSGQNARVKGLRLHGKSGTSSNGRDAWFVGYGGSVVTVVWLGYETETGLRGGGPAAKLFGDFMAKAVPARPPHEVAQPLSVIDGYVDLRTGLRVDKGNKHASKTWFQRGHLPGKKRWWRRNQSEPVIR